MKTHLIAMMVLVVMLVQPVALQAQGTDPVAVLMACGETLNAGDVDAAMALFTEDAVVNLAFFDETYTGAEEIRAWFEELVADNFEIQYEVIQVEGDAVTTKTTTWSDFTRDLGIAPIVATEVDTFRDGKITGFTWTPDEESVAKLQAALATLPETGEVAFPSYVWWLIGLGGLAVLAGLGLRTWSGHLY